MFGLFSPPRSARKAAQNRTFRPMLEGLEMRYAPARPPAMPPPPAPTVTMNVEYGTGHMITITGVVGYATPANRTVNFSGAVASGTQAITNSAGQFSVTVEATSLDVVVGSVTINGLTGTDSEMLANIASVITNVSASSGGGNVWTFEGFVTDEYAAGLTISFGGDPESLQGQTATVGANGWFSLTIQMNGTPSDNGDFTVQIMQDWWGTASNVAIGSVFQA